MVGISVPDGVDQRRWKSTYELLVDRKDLNLGDLVRRKKRLTGLRLDRDERHLQTETMGLTCGQEFVDPAKLERATAAVPAQRRAAA